MTEEVDSYRLLIADVYELAGESRRTSEALAGEVGQTAARWHVLSVLSDGPRTVAGAARRLGLARQSVQRVVTDLVDADLARLRANPDHARAPLVDLTAEGRSTLESLVRRSDADRSAVLRGAGLTPGDLDGARSVLRRITAALREQAQQAGASGEDPRGSVR